MRVIISAGGTGGHIYPALAIINKFKEYEKDLEVLYIGTHNRMENKIVPEHNIPYKAIKIYGFSKNIFKDIKNSALLIKAFNDCVKIMDEFKPDIVIGVGGYVTMPVLMAARKRKIKTAIHEQNSIPGKTNKFLSRGVDIVFTSFRESNKYFKDAHCIYSGNPSGDNVLNLKPMNKEELGFHQNKKLIIITSGSLGSSALNNKLKEFLNKSKDEVYEILFITGNNNYDEFINNYNVPKNIKIVPYLNNLASLFKASDLVIGRAGAGTISELITAKVPSILIPSPNVANNHQYYNAKNLEDSNLSIMIEEDKLDSEKLYKLVKDLLNNNSKYQDIKNNLLKIPNIASSDIIYKNVKELLKNVK